jgi:cytochrome c oxidase subunit 3
MSELAGVQREPWPSVARQREGVAFGMWVFLASEILFFGALFVSYAVYRTLFPVAFDIGSHETNILYGTINTALLLTSSFVMTIAQRASQHGQRNVLTFCLLLTAAFGLAFLVVKGLEYAEEIRTGLVPGPSFTLQPTATRLFFALYWVMTGVHAIHLAVGVGVASLLGALVARRRIASQSTAIDAAALYWHLVDSIWIVLYAIIYLPGRA